MSKVKHKVKVEASVMIYHQLLESKLATFAGLVNAVIKWGQENDLDGKQIWHIISAFEKRPLIDLKEEKEN